MSAKILITGATGNVGESIVRQLQQQINCRVAVRQVDRARALFGTAIDAVPFDFLDSTTFTPAFTDITRLFLVRPPALSKIQQIASALTAAKAAGVQQVVFLSILAADRNRIVPHAAIAPV